MQQTSASASPDAPVAWLDSHLGHFITTVCNAGIAAIHHIHDELDLTEVPIIALTALAMQGDRDRCIATGANDYLSKPIKLKQLVTTIQQQLRMVNIQSR